MKTQTINFSLFAVLTACALSLSLNLIALTTAAADELAKEKICRAFLAASNGNAPKDYAVLGEKSGVYSLRYHRADGKTFQYRCKLVGNEIKWMNLTTGPARWSKNLRGFFRIDEDVLFIRETFLGEEAEYQYKFSDLR